MKWSSISVDILMFGREIEHEGVNFSTSRCDLRTQNAKLPLGTDS